MKSARIRANEMNPRTVTEVRGSYLSLTQTFAYQSYFDATLRQNALLTQDPNGAIVDSTMQQETIPGGYSFALHPDSETPVTVQVSGLDGIGQAAPLFIKPGQIVSPVGNLPFTSFSWGLPFGWLGGGLAQLLVFTSPEAYVSWGDGGEIIFHRVRLPILVPGDITAAGTYNNAPKDWPIRFPWVNAQQGAKLIPQNGQPIASVVRPTRALMTLNPGSTGVLPLAAPAQMRILLQESQAFGLDSAGALVPTSVVFEDVNWPQWANYGTSGNLSKQTPLVESQLVHRLGADNGGVVCVDVTSGSTPLQNCFVDFVRMGRL